MNIWDYLENNNFAGLAIFSLEDLLEEYNKPYIVVTFLSVLEMVKEKEVIINQENNFEKILIALRN